MKSRKYVTPPSRVGSSRRRQQQQVPRLTPSSSESSASSNANSSRGSSSPDARIFKGAEILRSELLSSERRDLWSVSESMNHSFDDDWSDPWSVAEGHVKTPSPSSSEKYRPKRGIHGSSTPSPRRNKSNSEDDIVSSPDGSVYTLRSHSEHHGGGRKAPTTLDDEFPVFEDDTTEDWFADFESQDPSMYSQDPSAYPGGLDASSSRRRGPAATVVSSDSEPPPPPPARPPPAETDDSELGSLLTPRSDGTPTTTMGRESSLRFKTVTYLVEPHLDEMTFDDYENNNEVFHDAHQEEENDDFEEDDSGYAVPSKYQEQSITASSSEFLHNYSKLRKDQAYVHAQNAGVLWQTLVGQHVRFPKTWWNGARGPPMGLEHADGKYWRYIARHRIFDNDALRKQVKNRSSCGRLLLHVVVRDLMTFVPLQDVVIGCLHPNARGIRKTPRPNKEDEGCREVWMALRKRPAALEKNAAPSLIDPLLTRGRSVEEIANDSPLGNKRRVNNVNMRAVFGEKPPLQTVFIDESELYERMMAAEEQDSFAAPALVLLQEFT